jgi:serine/threonine protein kinase
MRGCVTSSSLPAAKDADEPSSLASRSLEDLEAALERAVAERAAEFASVESELAELSKTYDRLRTDIETVRQERDRALDAAREERERRARETLELTERLHEAMSREDAHRPVDAAAMRERFLAERLAARPSARKRLEEGALPAIEGFEILGRLGNGGMASVFDGRRTADGRPVAIKLLRDPGEPVRSRTELFLREAAAMLQLDHEGLVHALDAGECAYGLYLVMELVPGESLAARLRREGPVPEDEALRIAICVARALAYCARLSLNHRDVKPSNVLLADDGRVKLCDFGLAALASASDLARPYGSPGYASPEQLATPTDVDERADVYGLGCTLWHMVVGRRPFAGMTKQAFEEARTTDLPDPRFEGADVSDRLAQVIRRMGRADRTRRYRRWDECLLDLMLVERGNPPFATTIAEARSAALAEDAAPQEPFPAAEPAPTPPAEVLPPPETAPARFAAWRLVVAACLAVSAVLSFLLAFAEPSPVAELCRNARALAAEGRADEAARCLRAAARIASAADARTLADAADAIEKK